MNAAMTVSVTDIVPLPMRFDLSTILPEESHEPQPEHIKGCQERREHAYQPVNPTSLISPPQNLVLAEEPGQRRNSSDRKRGNRHRPERHRNLRPQPAHLPHVLLTTHSVDDRPCRKEEQSLEERMRHKVEDRCRECRNARSHEHVAKL